MPALALDAALVHVDRADARGNAQILGPDPYFDDLFCGAAKRRYVTCERIVETSELRRRTAACTRWCSIAGMVDGGDRGAVRRAPDRVHAGVRHRPRASQGLRAPRRRRRLRRRIARRYVDVDPAAYLAAVGGAERVAAIPPPIF